VGGKPEAELRIFPIEPAQTLSGTHFAAGKGHGLKSPLIAEFGLQIRLFSRLLGIVGKLPPACILISHSLQQTTTIYGVGCCHL
jgi:hypothetical protein